MEESKESIGGPGNDKVPMKIPSLREQLRDFLARYYGNVQYRPIIARETLEIYSLDNTNPQYQYVFDRKALQDNPSAELITFNSPQLKDIIDEITSKGRIAKGFIPFIHDPERDFGRALFDLVTRPTHSNLNRDEGVPKYILNGEIHQTGYVLTYAPFLVFLVKVTLKCIETAGICRKSGGSNYRRDPHGHA